MTRRAAYRRGAWAETVAAWWLRLKGYRVVGRHVTARRGTGLGEIDIVVRRGGVLAFVEVKARGDAGLAAAAISPTQRRRIERAARGYVANRPDLDGCVIRFDAVLVSPWRPPRHLADAWRTDSSGW